MPRLQSVYDISGEGSLAHQPTLRQYRQGSQEHQPTLSWYCEGPQEGRKSTNRRYVITAKGRKRVARRSQIAEHDTLGQYRTSHRTHVGR
eukprot:1317611-Rhodomonas_salina.1